MKNDKKGWLFWGFVVLVALNVILLAYVFMNSNLNIGLSPTSAGITIGDGCNDNNPNTICAIGDYNGKEVIRLWGSQLRDIGSGSLDILSSAGKIKLAGVTYVNGQPTEVPTDVVVNGKLQWLDNSGNFLTRIQPGLLDFRAIDNPEVANYGVSGMSLQKSVAGLTNSFITDITPGKIMLKDSTGKIAVIQPSGICFKAISADGKNAFCGPDTSGNWKCYLTSGIC
jgi:hypothetical protein